MRPKLRRLQDLQSEIYRQLQLLIPEQATYYDSFLSSVPGSPVLRLDFLERHPYTDFLHLTYQFDPADGVEAAPEAHIRMYNDARLAEATSFDPQQGFERQAHPWYPQQYLFQRNWRQNRTLDKWLSYLLHQGHGVTSMRPAADKIA